MDTPGEAQSTTTTRVYVTDLAVLKRRQLALLEQGRGHVSLTDLLHGLIDQARKEWQ